MTNAVARQRLHLRAGPLSLVLENGALRYVTLGNHEVVRGVYAALRDHNWATIEPSFTRYDVDDRGDSFSVTFSAEHREREIDFAWDGKIEGTAEGTVTFTFDGEARSTFRRNRIGLCVLHPMEAAGSPVTVEHPDGQVEHGVFPEPISPHQPFFDIVSIRQNVSPEAGVQVSFEGDIFEMEDQRNWTDASYKTYCTPLRDPYPVEVKVGTQIKQTLAIQLTGDLGRVRLPSLTSPTAVRVTIGSHPTTLLPPIGLGVAAHGLPLSQVEIGALKRLRLAHLRVTLELTRPEWEQRLDDAAAQAAALGVALEIEAICGDSGAGIDGLAAALASHVKPAPIARVLVFPKMGVVTTEPVMRRAREVFRAARLDVPLGGGTRADFVNANRAELPIDEMDLIGYAINPQVHAFDNASLVETLPGQRATVENARRIAGGKPVTVGPITLRQRLNPAATAAEPQVASDELPSRVDPRQLSSFCAGWTLGSIRHLAAAGAAALTYFETTGWLGVMERADGGQSHPRFPSEPGMLFPVYHVFAAIGDLLATRNRVELLPVEISAPRTVEALALQAGDQRIALVANLLDAAQRVEAAGNKALELEPHEVRALNLTIGDTS